MKTILLPLFCLVALFANAQTTPKTPGKFIIVDKIAMEGIEQKELYKKTSKWCSDRFKAQLGKPKKKADIIPIVIKAWHDITVEANAGNVAVQMYYTLELMPGDSVVNYRVYDIHYKTYPDEYSNYTSSSFSAETVFIKDNADNRGKIQPIMRKYSEATLAYVKTLLADLRLSIGTNESVAKKKPSANATETIAKK